MEKFTKQEVKMLDIAYALAEKADEGLQYAKKIKNQQAELIFNDLATRCANAYQDLGNLI